MRTTTPRRWPLGLFLIASLGLLAMLLPGLAGAQTTPPDDAAVGVECVECVRTVDVVIEKAWLGDHDHDTAVTVTVRSFRTSDGSGDPFRTETCDYDDLMAGDCVIEVPEGGSYTVTEVVGSGWAAIGGIGTYLPGGGPECGTDVAAYCCRPDHEHCITNEYTPPPPPDRYVAFEKAWLHDGDPVVSTGAVLTAQAYDAEGDPWGAPLQCRLGASGQFEALAGGMCVLTVPYDGTYSVSESLPGFVAVSGTGSGFVPGEEDFCEVENGGVDAFSAVRLDGHCVENDDIPPPPPPPPVTSETVPARASIVLTKVVRGGPELGDMEFDFTITCGTTELSVTLGVGEESGPLGSFPLGTECVIEEGDLPDPPDGYRWGGVDGLDLTLTLSGENDAVFVNELSAVQSETTVTTPASVQPAETVAPTTAGALPRTGGNGEVAAAALASVLVGIGLVLLARRRELLS